MNAKSSADQSISPKTNNPAQLNGQNVDALRRQGGGIVLYDGVCGLCNRFIKAVMDRDPRGIFRFASLQSKVAHSILTEAGKDVSSLKTIYLVEGYGTDNMRLLSKSRAALKIISQLHGPIRFLSFLSILPTGLLNLGYDFVAASRYRLFGKLDACPLPDPEHVKRFLDD